MDARLNALLDAFHTLHASGPVAVAFSGGVDSTLTLWAAVRVLGPRAVGVSVRSEFVCGAERTRAGAMAAHLGLRLCHTAGEQGRSQVLVRSISALADAALRANPLERCYLCKCHVLEQVRQAALEHFGPGAVLVEGTNADDDPARPGRRAVAEYGARSPLAECGIAKADVRELARLAGLPNADAPSNSCLATRVPTGHELTHSRLTAIEGLERAASQLGIADLRARLIPGANGQPDGVRLEVRPAQRVLAESCVEALLARANFLGFSHFTLGERS